jgi:uridine kinase
VVYLTHDHYYRDLSHIPMEDRSKTNFDHPDSLETDLLVQHLKELKAGRVANLPTYDFTTHSRTPVTSFVHPKRIIIVEGILVLTHPALCEEMDIRVYVVSYHQRSNHSGVLSIVSHDENSRTPIVILVPYDESVET